ncbi:MAG: hypothetical protein JW820_13200 [Spirochaetales bacterium]|nr:hypothetical protein [Spirochaetales bacterium]
MKTALSISLGSPLRDKKIETRLLGQTVQLERIGTNGDEARAREMYRELDGAIDAFGMGGINLAIYMPWKSYPLHSALRLVQDVRLTPYTDGRGLQTVLEGRVMQVVEERIGGEIPSKTAFLVETASRYGMLLSFIEAGYQCVFGDLMFALGIPLPVRTVRGLHLVARLLMPVVGRMPISMLYSTGEAQEKNEPKYEKYYQDASVIAGDWLYIKKHMPEDMEGKVIVTNTTIPADLEFMRRRGIKYLVTTTPIFEGRSFGTNATEAALIAAAGKGRLLTDNELAGILERERIGPTITRL